MRNIVIWGVGRIGELAYLYYRDQCNIACFVDSDSEKWNKSFHDIPICSPKILKQCLCPVIVAVRVGADEIIENIKEKYCIKDIYLFTAAEVAVAKNEQEKEEIFDLKSNAVIVRFSGGLGNQMFQYAFLKAQGDLKKQVYANISSYKALGKMPFQLTSVFKSIEMKFVNSYEEKCLINRVLDRIDNKRFLIYKEPLAATEIKEKSADIDLLKATGGIFEGYFQTCRFAELVKGELLRDFQFDISEKLDLRGLAEKVNKENYISVHVRRGDYLLDHTRRYYGNICTKEYYNKAIEYMKKRFPKSKFCFFSDDIEWVKENYAVQEAFYIDTTLFSNYQDWFDMYLMSVCKHNIIANSTFSWWGAWLNQNPEKVVIAPNKWINSCEYIDIYPQDWVLM